METEEDVKRSVIKHIMAIPEFRAVAVAWEFAPDDNDNRRYDALATLTALNMTRVFRAVAALRAFGAFADDGGLDPDLERALDNEGEDCGRNLQQ